MRQLSKKNILRYSISIIFLVLFTLFSISHFILGGKESASVDALCPFGGFESLYTFVSSGNFVPRVMISSFVLAISITITSLLLKRGFCGWICPFGAINELLSRLNKDQIKVPEKIDKKTRYLKYIILIIIIIGTALTGTLVFRGYDPFMTFFHFGKGILWDYNSGEFSEHIIPFIITLIVLASALFISRFWCKYFCPLGAITTIFSRFSPFKINRDKKTCIGCKQCDKVCQVNVKVSSSDNINNLECINCLDCVDICPKKSLSLRIFNKNIKKLTYVITLLILFALPIAIAKISDSWGSTPNLKLYSTGEKTLSGDDIKGWMTIKDISASTNIPEDRLISDLGLPTNINTSIPINKIKDIIGIDFHTTEVRDYIDNLNPIKQNEEPQCPWGRKHDTIRRCNLWEDKNSNNICDLSE